MPKGIRNNKETVENAPVIIRVAMRPDDYRELLAIVEREYRTPEMQAAFILARTLGTTNENAVIANRIREYAREKKGRDNHTAPMQEATAPPG